MRKQPYITVLILMLMLDVHVFAGEEFKTDKAAKPNAWQLIIAPYAWAAGNNGSVSLLNTTAHINITPLDVIKNISKVDAIFQLHAQLQKNRWALMIDTTYLKMTENTSATLAPGVKLSADITPELLLMDFGAFYSAAQQLNAGILKHAKLQLFLGGRHLGLKTTVRSMHFRTLSGQQGFTAPIIGAKFSSFLSHNWQLIAKGDVGGFGVDGMHNTWDLSVLGNYYFNWHAALALGFRMVNIHASRGTGIRRFEINSLFYGPAIGLVFRL